MKHTSDKQSRRNRILAAIKTELPKRCVLCGLPANDLAHIFPRSLWPEYYTHPKNVVIMCRHCHSKFDDMPEFRYQQTELIEQARTFASDMDVFRHFNV